MNLNISLISTVSQYVSLQVTRQQEDLCTLSTFVSLLSAVSQYMSLEDTRLREGLLTPRTVESRAGRAAPRDFPQASPLGNPSEKPFQPSENPVHPSSFTWINPGPPRSTKDWDKLWKSRGCSLEKLS